MELKIHHIGYLVKKIEASVAGFQQLGISELEEKGYHLIKELEMDPAIDKDAQVAFLMNPEVGI